MVQGRAAKRSDLTRAPERFGHTMRLAGLSLAVLVLLASAASCSKSTSEGDAPDTKGARVAVDQSALLGPGTEIAKGLKVPEGAALVGARFPIRSEWTDGVSPRVDFGWMAVLVVDGDPFTVWDAIVKQLGMADQARAEGACVVWGDPNVSDSAPATGDSRSSTTLPYADPDHWIRVLRAPPRSNDAEVQCDASERHWQVDLVAGVRANCPSTDGGPTFADVKCGRLAQRHLIIRRYSEDTEDDSGFTFYGADNVPDGGPTSAPGAERQLPPLPEDVPGAISWLPQEGERLDAALDVYLGHGAKIARKAHSVVAPAMLVQCDSGLVSVLESPLTPVPALESIELNDADGDFPAVSEAAAGTDKDGRLWATVKLSDKSPTALKVGGFELRITTVEKVARKSGAKPTGSWVLAEECGG